MCVQYLWPSNPCPQAYLNDFFFLYLKLDQSSINKTDERPGLAGKLRRELLSFLLVYYDPFIGTKGKRPLVTSCTLD